MLVAWTRWFVEARSGAQLQHRPKPRLDTAQLN